LNFEATEVDKRKLIVPVHQTPTRISNAAAFTALKTNVRKAQWHEMYQLLTGRHEP
jgi:hypothetical protein